MGCAAPSHKQPPLLAKEDQVKGGEQVRRVRGEGPCFFFQLFWGGSLDGVRPGLRGFQLCMCESQTWVIKLHQVNLFTLHPVIFTL